MQKIVEQMEKQYTEKQLKSSLKWVGLLNMFLSPLVFMLMWNWFMVPLGCVVIGYPLAMGVLWTVDFMLLKSETFTLAHYNETISDKIIQGLSLLYSCAYITLLGFIIQLFI